MATRPDQVLRRAVAPPGGARVLQTSGVPSQAQLAWIVHGFRIHGTGCLPVTGSDQAYRTISTGQLSALLRLHLRPIDVVVCHGPQGDLVLRGASRLDAFSGYPVRS
jgi:hypothetical protein